MLNNTFLMMIPDGVGFAWIGTFCILSIPVLLVREAVQIRRKNKPLREKLSRLHDEVLQVMDEKGIPRTDFSPEVDRIYSLSLDKAVREMEKALERVQKL
ncbi:MAG: hypothetical protein NC432_08805 [Roseburia sp.]|nr:hypothetical protein [Roseburia sp.]MCM1097787.1 hypothetical protein [Ruminococcus flavefaciens]